VIFYFASSRFHCAIVKYHLSFYDFFLLFRSNYLFLQENAINYILLCSMLFLSARFFVKWSLLLCSIQERDYRSRRVSEVCNQRSRIASRTKDNRERNRWHSWDDVIRPDRMIIYSDWSTTLRYSNTFRYKKDDSRGCGREQRTKE